MLEQGVCAEISVSSSQFSSETKTSLNKYNLQKIYSSFHFVFSSITCSWRREQLCHKNTQSVL